MSAVPSREADASVEGASQSILRCEVSTARALRGPVAGALMRAIGKRLVAQPAAPEDVEVALHEAVLNAAIHGNLGVQWTEAEPATALEAFLAVIAERLLDPALAGRTIAIEADRRAGWLDITVRDQGAGYVFTTASAPAAISPAAPHGRGFLLMRAAGRVERRLGGREVRLSVPLQPGGDDP